jgi:PAS domain S-box-containing protein
MGLFQPGYLMCAGRGQVGLLEGGLGYMLGQKNVLEVALASIGDAVIVTDQQGKVSFLNPIAESLTGWSSAAAEGQPLASVFRIVNERTRAPVEHPVEKVLRSGVIQGLANHTVLLSKDGREVPIDDSAAPIRTQEGEVIGVVLVFRDITERRQSELQAAWLSSIVQSSDDAIISKNLDGTITSWNPAAERLYGFAAAEIIGKPITTIIPPDLLDEERHILARLRRGERIEHFDTVRLTKHGERIDVSLTVSPIQDSEGTIVGASKIARDIRARRQLESRLRDEQRLKDEFLATLGHELRNPIAPIYTSAELLARSPQGFPGYAAVVNVIRRQVRHLTRLVDDLLDVARITQGLITLENEAVTVGDVIAQGVETVGPLLREKRHELVETSAAGPLFVRGDKARLVQCISNIVGNAAKYTPAGGQIRITTRSDNDQVAIEVQDNGAGIPADLLSRVFDLFVQGKQAVDRAPGGLGIGLTMVRRLVEMHGGSVGVRSPGPGRGTTVEMTLPLAEAPTASGTEHAVTDLPRRRVFLVDDNADAAQSLAMLLQMQGQDVQAVYSARDALSRIGAFNPDVVLLDIGLPEIDGYELIRRLKEMPDLRGARFVALTGYGQPADKERALRAGFHLHLVKPVSYEELARVLKGSQSGG